MTDSGDTPVRRRRRLAAVLPPGSLSRSVSILIGGAAIAQAVIALSSIIIYRLYSPAQFGEYGAASAIVAVLVTVGCLRYEVAIPLPRSEVRAANLVVLSILVAAGITAVFGLVLLVAGRPVLNLFHAASLLSYWWLLLAALFGGSVYSALLNFAIRHKGFGSIARTRVTQSVAGAGTQIVLGLASNSPAGLIAGEAVARTAGSGRLARRAWSVGGAALRQASPAGVRAAASRYRTFATLSSPAALLNAVGLYAPLLLIVAFYGARTGGLFAFGQRLIAAPLLLLTMSIAQVFTAEAAVLARADPGALPALFARTTRKLVLIGTPAVLALAVAAPLLTGAVFGLRWQRAGLYVAILAPFFLLQLATSPLGGTLDVLERQDLHLIREVTRVAITSGAVVIAAALHLSALQAIGVLSAAGTFAYVIYGLISWYAITRAEGSGARLVRSIVIYAGAPGAVHGAALPAGARLEVLDSRNIDSLLLHDQANALRPLLEAGHLGVAIVNEQGWLAYGWLALGELPTHLPRRLEEAPWIFRCKGRLPEQLPLPYPVLIPSLLEEARRRGLGRRERVYVDALTSQLDARRTIEELGFKPVGRLLTIRLPRMKRPIGIWTRRRA